MDIAIVTGASSSLGLAISRRLIQLGFRVYGLGGDYSDCPLNNVNFKPFNCDLSDPGAVEDAARQILEKEQGVLVLVNNAKYFGRNDFMDMEAQEMERILRINLLCPLVLSRTLANSLMTLQGFLIQLGSPHAETSRGGPVGAAASGGLKWMGDVLFHDLRHHGVKVCHLSPEPNRGGDPRSTARPGARKESVIDPEAVAQAIEQILQSPFGNIVTEMVLRPLRVKEPEHDPVIRLPRPHPMPVPYTVPREMIEAEDQLEDEEIEKNLRRKRQRRRSQKQDSQTQDRPDSPEKEPAREAANDEDKSASQKSRRGRGKSKGKPRNHDDNQSRDTKGEAKSGNQNKDRESRPSEESRKSSPPADSPAQSGPRRRSRRKPKPPKNEVGFLDKLNDGKNAGKTEPSQPRQANSEKQADKPDDKPVKKAARKSPKKTPSKKTARKTPAKKTAAKKAPRKAAKKASPRKSAKKRSPSDNKDVADAGKSS